MQRLCRFLLLEVCWEGRCTSLPLPQYGLCENGHFGSSHFHLCQQAPRKKSPDREQEVSPSQPDSPRSSCFFEALFCCCVTTRTQNPAQSSLKEQPRKLLYQAQGEVGMSHFLVYQSLQGTVPIGSSGFWFSFEHVAM